LKWRSKRIKSHEKKKKKKREKGRRYCEKEDQKLLGMGH
jgi:hypothetical protein